MGFYLFPFLFGIVGGLIRALLGLAKYYEKNKKENKLRFWHLFFTLFSAGLLGGVAGILLGESWKFSLVFGYMATDFMEAIYKIRMKQGVEI